MSYTLNTTGHPLDEAAAEVNFKVTNFEEAVLLTSNGAYLRSKAFCIGGGRFCLRVFPAGEKGKPGLVTAYLQNLTNNDFVVDLNMSVNEEITKTSTSAKVEAKKSWGWKFGEACKIGNTLLLVARVYVWENYNAVESEGEILSEKTEKVEFLTKDDLKSQVELMQSGAKTDEKQLRTEVKQITTEVKQIKTEVKQVKTELKQVKTELKQVKAEVVSDMVEIKTEVKKVKAEVVKVKAENKTEVLNLKSEVVKMKNELMSELKESKQSKELKELKELMSEVKNEAIKREARLKEEFARFESQIVAEMRPQPTMPECRICKQDMSPPTRIIMCQMGHKLCESCWMKPGLVNCPDHCDTPFIGRDLGMEAFLQQLTGRQH